MFLSPRDCARARAAVRAAVGDGTFELLVAYLAFIRTAHYWTEMHPEVVDPLAIQGEASRLLGERLLTDRACYVAIDEAQGSIVVERNFVRAGVPSIDGRYPLTAFNWLDSTLPMGGPVVVADARASRLIPDADRPAVAAVNVGAFVVAPLIRDGRLVATLNVSDRSSRAWTPDEVELVRETAERTWEAIGRARAEEQLRDAATRKDEFLAMLAHELRNPLAPIRTGLELIRLGGDSAGAVERVRGMMERQVGHMVRLIDDLLDVSRITSGKITLQREPTPLGILVHSAVEGNRAALTAKQIVLSVELPQDPCVIDVDPTRFVQILSNLLNNAAKFTNHGGSVRIAATVPAPAAGAAGHVLIAVADSGIGISPELLPRVFELFTQGDAPSPQPGLGIGLALARRLAELHAGRLDARSDGHGRGSEFVLQLPLATTRSISTTGRHGDEQRIERRILVVDDNQDVADATAMLIADMGEDARVAYDGESAILMLQEYDPEVIFLDIGMRGLDGYETCQQIRLLLGNRVFVVALTGFGQEQDKEKSTRAGFDAHLTKPANGAALAGILADRFPSGR